MEYRTTRRGFLASAAACATVVSGSCARAMMSFDDAGPTDTTLVAALESLVKGFHGDVGIYVRHLPTGRIVSMNADELFPTASMIKIAIMAGLFDRIVKGELDYHQYMEYTGEYTYKGMNDDILAAFNPGAKIRLSKLIMLMITISDNSASIWNQVLAGGGTSINRVLEKHGFEALRMNSRTPGREAAYEMYGWGQSSPREMSRIVAMIRNGTMVSPGASEEMYRILTRIFWSGEALSEIPPYVQVASKQGAVNRSRSEVVLVNAPHGDYVFCIMTKNQEDTSYESDNEGWVLIRKVSRAIWRHYEPDYGWEPAQAIGSWDR